MQRALNTIQIQGNSDDEDPLHQPQQQYIPMVDGIIQPEQDQPEQHEDYLMMISAAAYTGSPSASTISLLLSLKGAQAIALADTGSTSTFLDPKFSIKHNIPLQSASARTVTVAGGGTLISDAIAPKCNFTIAGQKFQADFRILNLQGSDVILGVNWFKLHNPVTFDFVGRKLTLGQNGNTHTFSDHIVPTTNLLISSEECSKLITQGAAGYRLLSSSEHDQTTPDPSPAIPDLLTEIVHQFEDIFSPPTGLPPHRAADHCIPCYPELLHLISDHTVCLTIRKTSLRQLSRKCYITKKSNQAAVHSLPQLSWYGRKINLGDYVLITEALMISLSKTDSLYR
jgi:hypothetical protein